MVDFCFRTPNVQGVSSICGIYILDLYIPGTCLSSILGFEPSKRRPKLHSKQGAPFGFQVYIYIVNVNYIYSYMHTQSHTHIYNSATSWLFVKVGGFSKLGPWV